MKSPRKTPQSGSSSQASRKLINSVASAKEEWSKLQNKVNEQKKQLKELQQKRPSKDKSFASQLSEEASKFDKLQSKLSRLEAQAEVQKKELVETAQKRKEEAKSTLKDLAPRLAKLETQYAAQQLELASVGATHALESSLLGRSIACMEEGTAALLNALECAHRGGGVDGGDGGVLDILVQRSQRLETSVVDMEADVARAAERLQDAERMNQARRSARSGSRGAGHRRTASTQMGELTDEMTTLRERRKKAAAESMVQLQQLAKALEQARDDAMKVRGLVVVRGLLKGLLVCL